jgi:hypothetical protein
MKILRVFLVGLRLERYLCCSYLQYFRNFSLINPTHQMIDSEKSYNLVNLRGRVYLPCGKKCRFSLGSLYG